MNTPRRKSKPTRRNSPQRPTTPVDLWRARPPLPDPEPIVIPDDPPALVRSLGDPPLVNASATGYFAAVIERAAAIAGALALSADLPSRPDDVSDADEPEPQTASAD